MSNEINQDAPTPQVTKRTFIHRRGKDLRNDGNFETIKFKNENIGGYLLITSTRKNQKIFPIPPEKEQKIGRKLDCDIVLKHNYISRVHAKCYLTNDGILKVKSVSPTNYSLCNNLRMKIGVFYEIKAFDVVNMMGFSLRFFQDPLSIAKFFNPVDTKRTGIYLDSRVCLHRNQNDLNHPESPNRIFEIEAMLDRNPDLFDKCVRLSKRHAKTEELLLCHSKEYIENVENGTLESDRSSSNIFMNKHTVQAALLAVGGVVHLVEKVLEGELDNGFAFIRPPGHHAGRDSAEGFCFFNNVAIAACVATKKYKKKVAIIDWDVHHGNGTQDILWGNRDVLYISTHRFGDFYPGTGRVMDIGNGKGRGYVINIPFTYGFNDQDMLYVFTRLILPVLFEFSPDVILISAGFDAVDGDPLGGCHLSPEIYGILTSMLKSVTNRVVLALEGGYNVQKTADCSLECLKVLVGNDPKNILTLSKVRRTALTEELVSRIRQFIHPFWKSIDPPRKGKKKKTYSKQSVMSIQNLLSPTPRSIIRGSPIVGPDQNIARFPLSPYFVGNATGIPKPLPPGVNPPPPNINAGNIQMNPNIVSSMLHIVRTPLQNIRGNPSNPSNLFKPSPETNAILHYPNRPKFSGFSKNQSNLVNQDPSTPNTQSLLRKRKRYSNEDSETEQSEQSNYDDLRKKESKRRKISGEAKVAKKTKTSIAEGRNKQLHVIGEQNEPISFGFNNQQLFQKNKIQTLPNSSFKPIVNVTTFLRPLRKYYNPAANILKNVTKRAEHPLPKIGVDKVSTTKSKTLPRFIQKHTVIVKPKSDVLPNFEKKMQQKKE